ncbi:MAG: 2-phospho-L-lactate transferase [Proteobacteria bacterium]|nr:2-phospho-L-lactate transferase [Pseudomonadota bacterium]
MSTPGDARRGSILAITGGVGGAKLALGLADELPDSELHLLVNTGDDFRHLGMHISPDIDTLLYTLSGRSNQSVGWGLEGESWNAMNALEQLGGETWFRLGDKDIATHLWRTQALAEGNGFLEVVDSLAQRMGIGCKIYAMSADPVRTTVCTDEGELPFQHYFVRRQCQPAVTGFRFEGIESARPNPAIMEMLQHAPPAAVVICPSNPFVSVDPVLQIPGMWQALKACSAPVIAVSPIVAGMAIKGPAAKMMEGLHMPVSALAVARYYSERYPGLLSGFIIDDSDATLESDIRETGMNVAIGNTVMHSRGDKRKLAQFVLQMAGAS